MRIAFYSDPHFDLLKDNREERLLEVINERLAQLSPDVLVVPGDVSQSMKTLARLLPKMALAKHNFLTPGNHDLWVDSTNYRDFRPERASDFRHREEIPYLAAEAGFKYLPQGPFKVGSVGFAGEVGWYDYSFNKYSFTQYDDQRLSRHTRNGASLNQDVTFIRWYHNNRLLNDKQIFSLSQHNLQRQLQQLQADNSVDKIVVATHMLPHHKLLHVIPGDADWDYMQAFMGSQRLAELYERFNKVKLALFGHTHSVRSASIKGIEYRNGPIGYTHERPAHDRASWKQAIVERIGYFDL